MYLRVALFLFCCFPLALPSQIPATDSLSRLPADLEPLIDVWMRDAYILKAPDGFYYLTGSTSVPGREPAQVWDYNDGIRLWRSPDLKNWMNLGLVWSFTEDATWQAEMQPVPPDDWEYHRRLADGTPVDTVRRAIWAPEIHYLKGNYYITASINWVHNPQVNGRYGTFLLKSSTGKPEGPYVDASPEPLTDWIDSSLFVDDDGSVYYLWLDGRIAKMKDDMSGFAGPPRRLLQKTFDPEPYIEGVFLFKRAGKYHLVQTFWSKRKDGKIGYFPQGQNYDYNCVAASSDNLYGPYSVRYTAIQGAGHNNVFQDHQGNWWSTYFGNPKNEAPLPFTTRPGIIPLRWVGDRFYPAE
jgi:beta-xylosidase